MPMCGEFPTSELRGCLHMVQINIVPFWLVLPVPMGGSRLGNMLDEEISHCITVTKPAVLSRFYTDAEILQISDRLNYGSFSVSSWT